MFKEQVEKVKALIVKEDGKTDKRKIENLVVFLVVLITTIIVINIIWSDDSKKDTTNSNETDTTKQLAIEETSIETDNSVYNLKTNLEEILSKINGVGKVSVLITYSESSETIAMYNENTKETSTQEQDTSGGTRTISESDTQKEVIYQEDGSGTKEPVTQKTVMPKIEGAIITADGGSDVTVKSNIIQAVEAVTGLATHKIQVFEMSQ